MTRHRYLARLVVFAALLFAPWPSRGQTASEIKGEELWTEMDNAHPGDWRFTSKTYNREATRVLIAEINKVVEDLNLPEQLPLTTNSPIRVHIPPPALNFIGTLTTTNYTYYVTSWRKFTGMDRRDLVGSFYELKAHYLWPLDKVDTNAAYKAGLAIMTKAGMDVAALNRDSHVEIHFAGPFGHKFLPDYYITWERNGRRIGILEFFAPTLSIRELRVQNPIYILRKPVEVPHLYQIFKEGNAPPFWLKRMGLDATNDTPYKFTDPIFPEMTNW